MTIGHAIRARRLAAGHTQQELARRAGVHVISLSRIECGHAMPSLQTVARIAEALSCDVSALLTGARPTLPAKNTSAA